MQTRYSHNANIGTTLKKIVTKAGLASSPCPKSMPNMRATREIELLAHYPAMGVTSLVGRQSGCSEQTLCHDYAGIVQQSHTGWGKDCWGNLWCKLESTPENTPHIAGQWRKSGDRQNAKNGRNPVIYWVYLQDPLAVLPLSCPTRT